MEPPCAPSSGSYHYLSLHPPFGISRPDRSWSIILSYSRLSYPSLSHSTSYLTLCVSYFHTLSPHSWFQPPAHNSPAWKLYHSQKNQPPSVSMRFCGISCFSRISSSLRLYQVTLTLTPHEEVHYFFLFKSQPFHCLKKHRGHLVLSFVADLLSAPL